MNDQAPPPPIDDLPALTGALVEEVLDDLFGVKNSTLLRWRDPESVLRTLSMVEELHTIALEGICVSLRGLYYRMAPYFRDQSAMTSTLAKITTRLQLDKEQLGIIPAAKGLIFGGVEIDGEPCDIQETFIDQYVALEAALGSSAGAVLIVEKHSVFDLVVRSRLMDFEAGAIVTGRGFPDVATMRFLQRLSALGECRFGYLGDYDPYGLQICLTYRRVIADLRWLGIRQEQVMGGAASGSMMELSDRDQRLLTNILLRLDEEGARECLTWPGDVLVREAELMLEWGAKCEIEAFSNSALSSIISFL